MPNDFHFPDDIAALKALLVARDAALAERDVALAHSQNQVNELTQACLTSIRFSGDVN